MLLPDLTQDPVELDDLVSVKRPSVDGVALTPASGISQLGTLNDPIET